MKDFTKHVFNMFPEMTSEEYEQLRNDIDVSGYDEKFPIYLYEDCILDGWNRYNVCKELNIEPQMQDFVGTRMEALHFVIKTNKRRNLDSSQRACCAARAIDIIKVIEEETEKERREKQSKSLAETHESGQFGVSVNYLTDTDENETRTTTKLAELFDTNRTYIDEAKNLQTDDPEMFEKVSKGKVKLSKVIKNKKITKRKKQIKETLKSQLKTSPIVYCQNAVDFLKNITLVDLLITDPPYSTDVDNIEEFAQLWLPLALTKIKDTGFAFVFIGAYPQEVKAYLNIAIPTQILIWEYKNILGNNPKNKYKQNYQVILFYSMPNAPRLNIDVTNEQWAVHSVNAPDGRLGDRYHAWQKPIELAERLIRHTTTETSTLIDPFCGTGTFLLAGAQLGRISTGCDISQTNLDIAIERGCINE